MVDALAVTYILLCKAGRLLSTKPSPATLWRWAMKGIDGTKLTTHKIGGRRYTTTDDLERFLARLNESQGAGIHLPTTREQEHQAIAAERATTIFGPTPPHDDPSHRSIKGKNQPRKQQGGK